MHGFPDLTAAKEVAAADLILSPGSPLISAREMVRLQHTSGSTRTMQHHNGAFYRWVGTHYTEQTTDEMRAAIYSFLDHAQQKNDKDELAPFNPNKAKVGNVLEATAAATQLSSDTQPPAWLDGGNHPPASEIVACSNGLLHLPARKLLPHSAAFFSMNALDFAYTPNAPEPHVWLKFLADLWPGDQQSRDALQEFFGLVLTADTSYQKAFLIVGPKRSGKGTIARVLTHMLGQANVAGPTLSSLSQNFGLAPLIGKRLAVISDARLSGKADQSIIAERILSITGEDSLTIDRKFREGWTGKLDARFLILSNELPRLSDASGALASRFVVLSLAHSWFGAEDRTLTGKLLGELPGILLWAMAGWDRLTKRGYFEPPASSAAAVAQLEDLGSPIGAFLRERCKIWPGVTVPPTVLYESWCDWCRDQGRDHPGIVQTFGRDLSAAVPGLTIKKQREGDRTYRIYDGIRLRTADDDKADNKVVAQ
jgi:putative DNA primase/helicase